MTITEASLRRHLKLDDHDSITSIPNSEIFEQLALMGYHTDSDKLTFQKGAFSPQWRFLIHTILHCLSPKKTAWEQFSSNIATAVICQSDLFPSMLIVFEPSTSHFMNHIITFPTSHETSPSHSPAPSFEHSPDHTTAAVSFPSPTQPTQPSPRAEQHIPTPHDSPLHAVHSHGSDEGSLKLIELTNLVTKLSERIGVLEDDLKKTKQTYSAAVTKLILRVKKLEAKVKAGTARKRARVVLSEDDEDIEDEDFIKRLRSTLGEEVTGIISVYSYFMARFEDYIEDVITKKIVYHLFDDEVEFLGCVFLSYLLALEITCSCFHDFIDKDLIDLVLPDVRRYVVVLTGIYYHLKELRCCAQCLIEDEDFIKRSRSTLGEEV
ncbi:hypothetical protein Tco_0954281 [Tanacetum coccineum]|uniref:Synaptobrevin, longin-like domain protein n=1 Tax=Tanacetum coccineum TaxID=301880 RepID=A0ABQ5E2B5_9ASTR